jgi:predicted DNA-binding ribbon-helix-helix protein
MSLIRKHTIVLSGRKTSIGIEHEFWENLREIALERGQTIRALIAQIDADRKLANLSSAVRTFVLCYYREKLAQRSALSTPLELWIEHCVH